MHLISNSDFHHTILTGGLCNASFFSATCAKLFQMPIQAITVFCGSRRGTNPLYKQEAETLGRLLAKHQVRLIYGGGKAGLMGDVADAVLQAGGTVRGVIPKLLVEQERSHQT